MRKRLLGRYRWPQNRFLRAGIPDPESGLVGDHALGLHLGRREASAVNPIAARAVLLESMRRVEIEVTRGALVAVTCQTGTAVECRF